MSWAFRYVLVYLYWYLKVHIDIQLIGEESQSNFIHKLIFFTWLNPLFELFFSSWLTEVDCALRREVGVVLVQVVTALSCIIAFCLNYTIFLNTTLNSALTQTMCGNLKDLGTVFFGWICFGGLPFDWLNVFGQFLGFLGSGMYAYCKLKGK
jgi:drug/metabolite transporter (DMT)-like permease